MVFNMLIIKDEKKTRKKYIKNMLLCYCGFNIYYFFIKMRQN